ncbi:MAG: HEAT repeat domain-containing protein [Planctomycetes bacterium]|nr:HEAT repeat domain-containing protein [Planctomycetota bacterium]
MTHTLVASIFVLLALLADRTRAQDLPSDDALRAAIAVEELEHDATTARARYDAIARDASRDAAIRRHAWLRLGRLAHRRGETDLARDALAQAAQGDDAIARAAQALAQQEPQDPARAKELADAAERAVAGLIETLTDLNRALDNVAWFGDAAVPPLIHRHLESRDARSSAALWRIGTKRALGFVGDQLASDDVAARRAILSGIGSAPLAPAAAALVRTALFDADDEVALAALSRAESIEIEDFCTLVASARPRVRSTALQALTAQLQNRMARMDQALAQKARESRAIAAALTPVLESTSPEDFKLATLCLLFAGGFSTEGRTLLVKWLPRLRDASGTIYLPGRADFAGESENAVALADTLEKLPVDAGQGVRVVASQLVEFYYRERAWRRPALDGVLRIARLVTSSSQFTQWLIDNATAEDAPRVVEVLAGSAALSEASHWLAQQALTGAEFEPIRRTLDWLLASDEGERWRPSLLLLALAKTGHPEALTWLRALRVKGSPRLGKSDVERAAVWYGTRRNDDATRAFLRELLTSDATEEPAARVALFGQLVSMGDERIWDDLTDVRTRAGDVRVQALAWWPGTAFDANVSLGIDDWLALRVEREGRKVWWHGYDPAALTAIWSRLLQPVDGEYGPYWLRSSAAISVVHEEDSAPPDAVVLAICDAHRARCLADPWFDPESTALRPLLWIADQPDHAEATRRDALARLRVAAFAAPSAKVRRVAVEQVDRRRDDATLTALHQLVADPESFVAVAAWEKLDALGAPVDRARVVRGFASTDRDARLFVLEQSKRCTESVSDLILPLLRDEAAEVRIEACRHFAARVELESVPALLETLKDESETVRRAAAESLQAIRLYHDEKARWARMLGGKPELGTAAAAEALVDQASPQNDVQTRLLAIRSLGLLAAPETLPLLIAWTRDQDASIASASREAVQRIHAAGK